MGWVIAVFKFVIGLFQPKSDIAAAQQAGVAEGQAQQKSSDQSTVIAQQQEVIDAQDRMATVSDPDRDELLRRLSSGQQ